jgi:hypothetical protein
MTETLHPCPKCQSPNFSVAGLKSHMKNCKGINRQTGLSLEGESQPPDWSRARQLAEGIKHHFRLSLAGQILLGYELQTLKVELGFCGSGRRAEEKAHSAPFKSLNRTWDQWTKAELGIGHDTANRLIETYEAAKSKLKKLGGQPKLLALLDTKPAGLTDESRSILSTLVDKLEWGDSQKALLEEFRLVKRHESIAGGDTSKHRKEKPAAAQQLAFAFFRPVEQTVGKLQRAVESLRLAPDYQRLLHVLPLVSAEIGQPSLTSLEAEIESAITGDLSKALADIRAVKAQRMTAAP